MLIAHAYIEVAEAARGLAFYCDGLGLTVKRREYGRIANMADPFGNGFDLIEFAAAGYDAVAR
jgi:catechol 2,3-dioxygenase-like lactoylglutathione lyase family enzyme